MFSFLLSILVLFGSCNASEPVATPVSVDGGAFRAVISPILLSWDDDEAGEYPLKTEFQFAKPQSEFLIVLSGAVYDPNADHSYADAFTHWQGFKCSHIPNDGLPGRPGPLNRPAPLPASRRMEITLTFSDASEPQVFQVDRKSLARPPLELVGYVFRQNRLLFRYSGSKAVSGVELNLKKLGEQYAGALRIQFFKTGSKNKLILEEYQEEFPHEPAKTNVNIGEPIGLLPESDYPFVGDSMVPVGFETNGNTTVSSIEFPERFRGREVFVEISGIFMFSSFSVDAGDFGGGGGLQDAGYRFDHVRPSRYIYPNLAPSIYDCRLRLNGDAEALKIALKDGDFVKGLPYRGPGELDPRHRYTLAFKVPSDGRVRFSIRDWTGIEQAFTPGRALQKTWDNAGVLFVRVIDDD